MASGAALALPAQCQQELGKPVASQYVTYAALPYLPPVEYLCVWPQRPCLYGLASDTDTASR